MRPLASSLQVLTNGLADGKLDLNDLKALGATAKRLKNDNGYKNLKGAARVLDQATDILKFFLDLGTRVFGAQVASAIADITPGVGDAKGIIEIFTGRDVITGDDLGWMRFAGVLAVIPFLGNAAKNAVKGKKYAEMLDLAKKYMKIGGEAFSNLRTKLGKWACGNSFTPDTKVLTKAGLVAIASLAVGSKVMAYNEQNRTEGEYTVTAVHVHEDLTIINLSVETRDPKNDNTKLERIETTPGHPFRIVTFVDGKHRPKPEGHEDLSNVWVGAGDLKVGDTIKRSNGQLGVVKAVEVKNDRQVVYNLTVEGAHTFFVGEGQWLVHNSGCDDWVRELYDEKAIRHILDGDATGGGHRFGTGKPGKSEFPSSWNDNKILREGADVLTDPKSVWSTPDGRGYITTTGTRDGIDIKVVFDTKHNRIVSVFPTNVPRNPR
jgi:hypothetical protein